MSSGLYSGASGLALGTGLYKGISGLWSGASGLITGFGGAAFSPASLFAAGESGYWLDPSDFSTMFQDSAGTTPVTATGQTVGLILDKSQGLVRGSDLVSDVQVDFNFNPALVTSGLLVFNGPKSWSAARDASGNPNLVAKVGSALRAALGVLEVSFTLSDYDGPVSGITTLQCVVGDSFTNTRVITTAGTYTLLVPQATALTFSIGNNGRGYRIDNLVVRQISGNHFLQATAASRPLVQTDGTNIYLSFDGTDDGLQSAATINPGAVDTAQVFAGVRRLSDVGNQMLLEASVGATSNNGAISVASSGANYTYGSRGTTFRGATGATFAAPITNVLTGTSDISGDSVILRVNGEQVDINTFNQGTGNYLTYTHYIGRRGGTTQPYDGQLYSLIVRYGPNLDAAIITQSENYVNSKTGAF